MPTISKFYGMTIYMYPVDHEPPHIHVIHDGIAYAISIETGEELYKQPLKPHAKRMLREWISLHREELQELWETKEMRKIKPLDQYRKEWNQDIRDMRYAAFVAWMYGCLRFYLKRV